MVKRVEKSLDDPYDLELGRSNIDGLCQVLGKQFKNFMTEFKPSMLKLQKALDVIPPDRKNKDHLKSYNRTLKSFRSAIKECLESIK
jgi:hypothetical protein